MIKLNFFNNNNIIIIIISKYIYFLIKFLIKKYKIK